MPSLTDSPDTTAVPSGPLAPAELPTADDVVTHTLLNCLLREVSGPERQTVVDNGRLLLRLPRRGVLLRISLRRTSLLGAHRFTGPVSEQAGDGWATVDWRRLAEYTRDELSLRTGERNDEFLEQIASSHQAVTAGLAGRRPAGPADDRLAAHPSAHLAAYLTSEQSLLFGHRFHPTPKARTGDPRAWSAYSPETGSAFPLRHLAVRAHLIAEETAEPWATAALNGQRTDVPDGYRLLPTHPWQYDTLRELPLLRAALECGDVIDLGPGGLPFAATASVRTLYDGETFLKFSLNVRITNCLRKNSSYELSGAVALTRALGPALTDLAERFPGSAVLREPGYRTLALPGPDGTPDRELFEGFGVIVREGLPRRLAPGTLPCSRRRLPTSTRRAPRTSPGCSPARTRTRPSTGGRRTSICPSRLSWPPTSTTDWSWNRTSRTYWSAWAPTAAPPRSCSGTWRAPSWSPSTTPTR